MSVTIIVPRLDFYEKNPHHLLPDSCLPERLGGYPLKFDKQLGASVIEIKGRLDSLPWSLNGLQMARIIIQKNNSPLTKAVEGVYRDDWDRTRTDCDIWAHVETYVRDGVYQQSLRLDAPSLYGFGRVNDWFDDLLAGKKNHLNTNPTELQIQPMNLQVLRHLERAQEYYMCIRRTATREQLCALNDKLFSFLPPVLGFEDRSGDPFDPAPEFEVPVGVDLDEVRARFHGLLAYYGSMIPPAKTQMRFLAERLGLDIEWEKFDS